MADFNEYKGVWVFAEQREGELQKVSLELLGEGRRQADKLGVKLTALLLGSNIEGLSKNIRSIYRFRNFPLHETRSGISRFIRM